MRAATSDFGHSRRGFNDWDAARSLAAWLNDHPKDSVLLLCSRFRSALMRSVLDDVLDPAKPLACG